MMANWVGMAGCAVALLACSSSSPTGGGTGTEGSGAASDAATSGSEAGGSSKLEGGASDAAGASSGGHTESGAPSSVDAKLLLEVPSSFTGATRELDVVVVPQLPVAGPPAAILYQASAPAMTAGQAVTIHGDATGVSGSYYVVVVLYMQGGGSFQPKAGVDYTAQSAAKVAFTGGPVDLGTLTLTLAGSDGGP